MTNRPTNPSRVPRLCLIALAGLIMGLVMALAACDIIDEGKERISGTSTTQPDPTVASSFSLNPATGRTHLIVELDAPPESSDIEVFAQLGLVLLEPLEKKVWFASVAAGDLEKAASLGGVREVRPIKPQDKLSSELQEDPAPYDHQSRDGGRIAYSVLFHKDVTAASVQALAREIDIAFETFDPSTFGVIRAVILHVPTDGLTALMEADIVSRIEPDPGPVENHNQANAQPLSNINKVQLDPFNLDGTGITVGIWEAQAVVLATHQELTPRVIVQPGQTAVNSNHAAHVAGTVGSSGVNSPATEGMAPNVTIFSWDAASDANEMIAAATSPTPIQISNHSYGLRIGWNNLSTLYQLSNANFGNYNNRSVNFDNVVAQNGLIVAKSAGNHRNDGPGLAAVSTQPADCLQGGLGVFADCIGGMGSAKNVITVGAMNGAAAIAAFSSFGPTDDGRIKPDLMAEGCATNPATGNCGMTSLFAFLPGGVASNINTGPMGGTSMATPVVAGTAALVLQEANTLNVGMSPAAVKALLIQTAQDVQLPGTQATLGPDYATGWGIVDAEAAVNLLRQGGLAQGTLNATGIANAWTETFYVPAGQSEVHLTLVWDDPAGVPNGQILINDLDLRLFAPDGSSFTPWILGGAANPGQVAVRNGGNDAVNNVEQVSVSNPMAGVWTARVSANAGNLPQAPQAFAVAGLLPQTDVVMVMDRSGSMSLDSATPGVTKLEALQNAANEFVDLLDLGGGHRLGLIQFHENVISFAPPFDLQQLGAGNVGGAHGAINGMVTGGWTNIIDGVDEAANQLDDLTTPFPRQAIVVFSDGKHNRPVGSDLNNIDATVQTGGYSFYSIGFGTDVDDAILTNVANNSGGIHVNEQDLNPIQLTKYFLTVGAQVHNMAVLADPAFDLGEGHTAEVEVDISALDQSFTVAVNWTGSIAQDVTVALRAPDKTCDIPLKDHPNLQVRQGEAYKLIKVTLPYDCQGQIMHQGTWTIQGTPEGIRDMSTETVDIMVLGDSRLDLSAGSEVDKDMSRISLFASFLQDEGPVRDLTAAILEARILLALPNTGDSQKQDRLGNEWTLDGQKPETREDRIKTIRLLDTGKDGDRKAGDGIHTAVLEMADLAPGLAQVRLVGTLPRGDLKLKREAAVSFYVPEQ